MTNKEAKAILEFFRDNILNNLWFPNKLRKRLPEALDLAIKALQERPQGIKLSETPGEWINQFIGGNECVMCSECKLHFDIGTNYCPNCGADMRGNK